MVTEVLQSILMLQAQVGLLLEFAVFQEMCFFFVAQSMQSSSSPDLELYIGPMIGVVILFFIAIVIVSFCAIK